jgi:hypothetical protein
VVKLRGLRVHSLSASFRKFLPRMCAWTPIGNRIRDTVSVAIPKLITPWFLWVPLLAAPPGEMIEAQVFRACGRSK